MKRPKILVITGALPYPLVTGAKIRTFNLLKTLARKFDIHLLTIISGSDDNMHLEQISAAGITCHYHTATNPDSPLQKGLDATMAFLGPQPYLTRHYTLAGYRRRLLDLLASNSYDVIHNDSISMTGNLRGLDKNHLILTAHNIEQNIWAGYAAHARGPIIGMFFRNQYRKVKRLEENLADVYGNVVTVSEDDKRMLAASFPANNITVVENGVDPEAYHNDFPIDRRAGIIFTGSLDWHPNIDGLTWFVDAVHPYLTQTLPECAITVVGRRPSQSLKNLLSSKNGLIVHADVPAIQPHLHAARVMMVPLRIGGGSRLKILEAMAAGVPVVSTTKGAEGLRVVGGQNILIEDDPKRFAEALVNVLCDDRLHGNLSRNGLGLIRERYSWDTVAEPLAQLWMRVANV